MEWIFKLSICKNHGLDFIPGFQCNMGKNTRPQSYSMLYTSKVHILQILQVLQNVVQNSRYENFITRIYPEVLLFSWCSMCNFIFFSFYLTNFSYKEENKTFSKTIVLAFLAQKKNSNADRFHTLKIILRATITASNIYLEQTHVISVNYTRVSV